ncbi:MAG: sigma-70 family RNA polymerase sigma factor [Lentimicrobiaceae bacterium]|nr:sigma-70 family RNA polymerase sigma factor [Lentimicrobiaceae bacterium]
MKAKSQKVTICQPQADRLRKQSINTPSVPARNNGEIDFIDRLKRGENLAYRELEQQEHGKTYRLIRRMVLDQDDANDLTQDTFIKVFENINDFQGKSKLSTWIYRIAVNSAKDFLRSKHRKRRDISVPIVDNIETKTRGYSTGREKYSQDIRLCLKFDKSILLSGLSDNELFSLKLRDSGYKSKEIAEMLEKKPSAVDNYTKQRGEKN